MTEALAKVQNLIEERDKLVADIVTLQKQLVAETTEKLKYTAKAQKVVCDLKAEVNDRKVKEKKSGEEIENLGKLWEESADVYFHAAIKQMKFLNPGVELQTRGMSTLCMVKMVSGTELKWTVTSLGHLGMKSQLARSYPLTNRRL
ncbi:hypothetical protein SESBI_26277 [Sesbania bispinosa]|nr:hypothetical protein SESBI_26277 [Sesbania bispinosa]